jgi:nicotinamide mononucleotide transporter
VNVLGWDVPTWVLDWSGSVMVVVSLWYLFEKRITYWHWW